MKKWEIQSKFKVQPFGSAQVFDSEAFEAVSLSTLSSRPKGPQAESVAQTFVPRTQSRGTRGDKSSKFKVEELVRLLFQNRGIKTKKEIDKFLNPKLENVTTDSVGINKKQLQKAIKRIKKAIEDKEQIVVFGDYDVDGICGTAILWETLHAMGAKVTPYIPHRIDEGYGLSLTGISNIKNQIAKIALIITVDNGIVANEAVDFANKNNIDVIITDHHVPSKKMPNAYAIVHTTKLCGTGVAYLLSQEFKVQSEKLKMEKGDTHLELVALATVADLVPLIGANRTLVKFGLEKLQKTKRVGLLELFKEAVINLKEIRTYEIGHIIAPRLNAMGRLEYAMDSLRLLCTKNADRARNLASKLGSTNKERQRVTGETVSHAIDGIKNQKEKIKKLLFVAHESYQQGVIGLVAGKLVEEFYRPAIVLSIGEKYSKASARSVSGFNMIEFIRGASELLVDAGGHPMAAGFTVETVKLILLKEMLEKKAHKLIDENMLTRLLRIDMEIPLFYVDTELYNTVQKLAPFGMANPEPTFVSRNVVIEDMRFVGRENKHLKLKFKIKNSEFRIEAIAFGMGDRASEFHVGDSVDIAYTIDLNKWNGSQKLQLKIRDIKP
ncbi:MAG: single-stranded-DNA-specific exonuclease RecJ [Candidatus Levybacteria bacterium]|nr:single-stranded-DNA-specific exonuclease RecJ [Candidatus Levybacteria bacterium]